ncbi:hypothetical protein V8C35DRAFT_237159 [Trichoderma chlorosporum]
MKTQTGSRCRTKRPKSFPSTITPTAQSSSNISTRYPPNRAHTSSAGDAGNLPSQIQKEDTLEAALKAGYTHLIPQLLHHYGCMELDIKLFGFQVLPTLLEFAVEQENTKVLKLFIEEGAPDTWGQALFGTVKKGHQELIAMLAKVADRVNLTRALGRAADRRDSAVIRALLASGAEGDFEDSDRPPPLRSDCCLPTTQMLTQGITIFTANIFFASCPRL